MAAGSFENSPKNEIPENELNGIKKIPTNTTAAITCFKVMVSFACCICFIVSNFVVLR